MPDYKRLKHLKRLELLEILVALSEENETLKARIASLQSRLDSKEVKLNKAGSIAEAAVLVNGVFESVQAAAEQYLVNIKKMSDNTKETTDRMLADTTQQCESMKRQAQAEIDGKWSEFSARMEQYCSLHEELQAFLPIQRNDAGDYKDTEK